MKQSSRSVFDIATVSTASTLQIVIQFVFAAILARIYGTSADMDAYVAALVLPVTAATIATGSISYVLVPELVGKFESADPADGWRLATLSGIFAISVSLLCTIGLFVFSDPICNWLSYPGGAKPLLRILSLQVVLTGVISWGTAVHHGRNRFLAPALGGVAGTGVMLTIASSFGASTGIDRICWAMNLGSLVGASVTAGGLIPRLRLPVGQLSTGILLLSRFWPLLCGTLLIRLDPLVDRWLAKDFGEGALTSIDRAQKLLLSLLTLGTSSLAIVAFPQLTKALGQKDQFGLQFSLAMRRTLLIVVPIAVGFGAFSTQIVRDVFEGGEWTSADTAVVAHLIVVMLGMFVGASTGELFARAFYVLGDTKTPTLVGVIAMLLGLAVKFSFASLMELQGIAIGISVYYLASASVMGLILVRRAGWEVFSGTMLFAVHSLGASVCACGVCYLIYSMNIGNTWLAGPCGVLGYAIGLLLFGNQDAWKGWELIRSRLDREKRSG